MAVSQRSSFETDFEWHARQEFINAHKDSVPVERLEALSMVWLNMKFLGCRYPAETESEVEELERTVPIDLPDRMVKAKAPPKDSMVNNLVIYLPAKKDENMNPISVLIESAQKCKKNIVFDELGMKLKNNIQVFSCAVMIADKLISTGEGITKKEAKRNTADKALEILQKYQRVVTKKHLKLDTLETGVSKQDLVAKAYTEAPKISEDNIGNKLLRKLGWSGSGGVGKVGKEGIDKPIMVLGVDGRQGLGTDTDSSVNQTVKYGNVKETLMNFIRNGKDNDLKFSPDLSKEDRAIIHKISKQFGLKHRSYGQGEGRYLVVSRQDTV